MDTMMKQPPVTSVKMLLTPFQQFIQGESMGGLLLVVSAAIAFWIANSSLAESYFTFQKTVAGFSFGDWSLKKPLILWINDGLMAVFFLMVGLEIKREIFVGELSQPRDAALSVFAALGGMAIPALIYAMVNWNRDSISGWGIPMATDIAFALGIMSLLGNRVPLSLKVFLTALAIVDDLGAVLVIAIFYTASLDGGYLLKSFAMLLLAFGYGFWGGKRLFLYLILGSIGWYFMLKSGVHATIAGVILAFAVPMNRAKNPTGMDTPLRAIAQADKFEEAEVKAEWMESLLHSQQSPLHRLEHALQPWVAYGIMPVFALFNAGVPLGNEGVAWTSITIGCFIGLVVGKPVGILLFSWLSCRLGLAALPADVSWPQIAAVGILAGIGFTMSFFVAGLAFESQDFLDQAKIGVLLSSILAAVVGLSCLGIVRNASR